MSTVRASSHAHCTELVLGGSSSELKSSSRRPSGTCPVAAVAPAGYDSGSATPADVSGTAPSGIELALIVAVPAAPAGYDSGSATPADVIGTEAPVAGIVPTPTAAAIGMAPAAAVAAGCTEAFSGVLGGGPVTPGSISPRSSTVSTMITCSVLCEAKASAQLYMQHAIEAREPCLYPGGTTKLKLCHKSAQ